MGGLRQQTETQRRQVEESERREREPPLLILTSEIDRLAAPCKSAPAGQSSSLMIIWVSAAKDGERNGRQRETA